MNYNFQKATLDDIPQIWIILQQAILRRKNDGSNQWQDGYPNQNIIENDIQNDVGYVLTISEICVGYIAILINDEPAYDTINGQWLTNSDFIVVHRLAISDEFIGQGLAQKMMLFTEEIALKNNIISIKVDTNFDNIAMLKIFEKLGYTYCGEVQLRAGIRKAFEKVID